MAVVLHQRLVKLQEKELLLMQQQQRSGNHQNSLACVALGTCLYSLSYYYR
jgi:hypothetical protein